MREHLGLLGEDKNKAEEAVRDPISDEFFHNVWSAHIKKIYIYRYPTNNGGMQKRKLSGNICIHVFCMFGRRFVCSVRAY